MIYEPRVKDYFVESKSTTGTKNVAVKKYNYNSVYGIDDILGTSPFSFFGTPMDILDVFGRATNLGYGRIDSDMHAVTPRPQALAPLAGTKGILALNFVAQAFGDLQYNLMSEAHGGNKEKLKGGPYANFFPVRAWQSTDTRHAKMLENIYVGYLVPYLVKKTRGKEILTFEDFLKIFLGDFFNSVMLPEAMLLTRSGHALCRNSSPLTSGLIVDVAAADYNNDSNKYNNWLKHPSYGVVRDAAANFGFALDKHAPWRFVANLQSPNMLPYIQGKGLLKDKAQATRLVNGKPIQAVDVYNVFYEKLYKKDVDVLKSTVYNFYSKYVEKRPYTSLACAGGLDENASSPIAGPSHSSVTYTKARQVLTFEEMEKKYDDYFWLNQYFLIRLAEAEVGMGGKRVKRQLKKISYINKYLGHDKALKYINEYVIMMSPPLAGSLFGGNASGTKNLQITGQAAEIPGPASGDAPY